MTSPEFLALLKSEAPFFAEQPDIAEAYVHGSALAEAELTADADLLIVPKRELSMGEGIDLRQAVWAHFKAQVPVMLEVRVADAELSPAILKEKGVPVERVYPA